MVPVIVAAVVVIFLVILFARTIRIVPQARAGIVERLEDLRPFDAEEFARALVG